MFLPRHTLSTSRVKSSDRVFFFPVISCVPDVLLSGVDSFGIPITKTMNCLSSLGFRCLPGLLLCVFKGNRAKMQ